MLTNCQNANVVDQSVREKNVPNGLMLVTPSVNREGETFVIVYCEGNLWIFSFIKIGSSTILR